LHFHLRGCHPLWPAFPDRSINTFLSLFLSAEPSSLAGRTPSGYCGPATPDSPFESPGLGYSDFARHYFRNHGCFLFLRVLRWFTSPGLLQHPMDSDAGNACSHALGFPIRKSPDHSLLAASRSLSQLTTSFFAFLRLGIHTHALSSLTIKSTLRTPLYDTLLSTLCFTNLCISNARQYSVVKDRPEEFRSQESASRRSLFTSELSFFGGPGWN
jgi:hypothetical protein